MANPFNRTPFIAAGRARAETIEAARRRSKLRRLIQRDEAYEQARLDRLEAAREAGRDGPGRDED